MKVKKKAKVHDIRQRVERSYDLKIERLLNQEFSEAFKKLSKMPMRPLAAMKVKRANLAVYDAVKDYIDKRTKVFEAYCERDEKGELVYEDEGKTTYKVSEEKKDQCLKELNELTEKTVRVPIIGASAFLGVDVSGEFLTILDGLVAED